MSANLQQQIVTRPILFSGPMVRAILDGRKTQTRRIVKPQPASPCVMAEDYAWMSNKPTCIWPADYTLEDGTRQDMFAVCQYGKPCDRLWVRETWCHAGDDNDQFKYNAEGNLDSSCCHYRADGYEVRHLDGEETKSGQPKSPWVPSIHMPRWASRLTLEITGVRVDRLNEISEEDAIREGVQCAGVPASLTNRGAFAKLWESINGEGSWAKNPWVWVVEFKVV